jgi:acyl-coenzyme A thioesterase PaaI-like protein
VATGELGQRKPLFRRAGERLRAVVGARALKLISFYPPYLGANVRVRAVSLDATCFDVEMRLTFWNQNYFGTHFGGSLYAMCDPFFALILTEALGPDYVVWDKAGSIRFLRPGRGTVRARFEIPPERIESIRREADEHRSSEVTISVDVRGSEDERVAHVTKVLSVHRRGGPRRA